MSNIFHALQLSYLGIYRPTFLYHWVKTRCHGLVLPVRRARCAWRPGTAVVGGIRHSSGKWTSYWRRLGGTKKFVRQSICWDWRWIKFRVTTVRMLCVITNRESDEVWLLISLLCWGRGGPGGTSWLGSTGGSGVRQSNSSRLIRWTFLKFSTSCCRKDDKLELNRLSAGVKKWLNNFQRRKLIFKKWKWVTRRCRVRLGPRHQNTCVKVKTTK